MFEISLKNMTSYMFNGSKVFEIENFYQNPNLVINYILSNDPLVWKSWDQPSYNGHFFSDLRHNITDERFVSVSTILEKLTGQLVTEPKKILTNYTKFYYNSFNNYKQNFWAPHEDLGYTAIVYLNKYTGPGTNLYERSGLDYWTMPEHYEPWRNRKKYKIIKTFEAKFNKLILFDGNRFCHGMAIEDETFFETYRFNQAIFMKN